MIKHPHSTCNQNSLVPPLGVCVHVYVCFPSVMKSAELQSVRLKWCLLLLLLLLLLLDSSLR